MIALTVFDALIVELTWRVSIAGSAGRRWIVQPSPATLLLRQ
jgi:hypothetical protein